jgi:NADPH-dependent curcumin reductase CurA
MTHQILLVRRPTGAPTPEDFRLIAAEIPPLAEGEVLVRSHYMSLDPYMRGRMNDSKSYTAPQPLDAVMGGGAVGEVTESRSPAFAAGDMVVGPLGWQEHAVMSGKALKKIDVGAVPASAYLGAVGMPGVTAWYGLNRICAPKAGETIAVSAASGAVGSVVGQLAKRQGCRVVGIAGGAEKCRYVVDDLGFDACVDYKAPGFEAALDTAAPGGIDGYFDNVGGAILDAVMVRMNAHGRIAVCGAIAGYDGQAQPLAEPRIILTMRLLIQGFIVSEHLDLWPQALAEIGAQVAEGSLKYRESTAHGLENAVQAFLGMLKGKNFGKQVVKLF